jgi:hypothetical protein
VRLLSALTIALTGIALSGIIVGIGMVQERPVADVVALSAIPGAAVTLALGYLFGRAENGFTQRNGGGH